MVRCLILLPSSHAFDEIEIGIDDKDSVSPAGTLSLRLSLGLSVGVDDNSRNLAAHLFQCCLQTVQM